MAVSTSDFKFQIPEFAKRLLDDFAQSIVQGAQVSIVVLAIGLIIIVIGLAVLVKPARLKDLLYILLEKDWFRIVAALRVIIGVLFLFAAGGTRSPIFVSVMGILFILAGVLIPILGPARRRSLTGRDVRAERAWKKTKGNEIDGRS